MFLKFLTTKVTKANTIILKVKKNTLKVQKR
ncbi:hypothetical protein SAMN05421769_0072 [Chryseobacterium scophthalmum]|uniref:Uncharacterized protein n=1 Tax=Chryseobacterium scophthalmum TaxID=59733 RepID=A0A1N6EAF0_9FLAO|nr:hypothetical protein SAMN05421769_0072 [Chryseobacterium scophthalmum]